MISPEPKPIPTSPFSEIELFSLSRSKHDAAGRSAELRERFRMYATTDRLLHYGAKCSILTRVSGRQTGIDPPDGTPCLSSSGLTP